MTAESLPPAELESLLGTGPGMIYRTRLEPPFEVEYASKETLTVTVRARAPLRPHAGECTSR